MVNKVILVGNVGKDPETRVLENSDVKTTSFSLATQKSWKNKQGEKQSKTEWHNIVLWRGLAEVAEKYVKKGDKLYLEGEIVQCSWDDKDGNKRYITEIVCNNMQMLGSAKSTESSAKTPPSVVETSVPPADDDDLPF